MTGRSQALTTENSLLSDAEAARIAAEELLHQEYVRKAARVVAASATDLDDARMLFDILGIDTAALTDARGSGPKGGRARRRAA